LEELRLEAQRESTKSSQKLRQLKESVFSSLVTPWKKTYFVKVNQMLSKD
jgi:hypothetical protein